MKNEENGAAHPRIFILSLTQIFSDSLSPLHFFTLFKNMRIFGGSFLRWPVLVVLLSPTAICFDLGFFGKSNPAVGAVFDPLHPHDYGVDVSTQIHGRLRKDTFHVRFMFN